MNLHGETLASSPAVSLFFRVMPMFRRKPIVLEAVKWTGDDRAWQAIYTLHAEGELVAFKEDDGKISIETVGRRVAVQPGDWVIKAGAEGLRSVPG